MASKHSQRPDVPIIAAFVGAHQAREELAEARRVAQRAQRAAADLVLLDQSTDADLRHWRAGDRVLDACQQPGCHGTASWFVRFRRGTTHRPAYRRLCTRDAARRIRRRTHQATRTTSRRDITR